MLQEHSKFWQKWCEAAEARGDIEASAAHLEDLPAEGVVAQQMAEELGHVPQLVRLQPVD